MALKKSHFDLDEMQSFKKDLSAIFKRLIEYLNLNRSQRGAEDLDRSYCKTLEELRRQIE